MSRVVRVREYRNRQDLELDRQREDRRSLDRVEEISREDRGREDRNSPDLELQRRGE